jgi:FkbM family methyltransferase
MRDVVTGVNRLVNGVKRFTCAPSIKVHQGSGLIRLGSEYGGWVFEDAPDLYGSTIISCGLGEDASFDVEFAVRYNAKVILVDPTPRALAHFDGIISSLGQPKKRSYVNSGKEPISAYPLETIAKDMLVLEPSAVWRENTHLKFFLPRNPEHVSHSIVNYQNGYAADGAHIEVPAVTIEHLVGKYALNDLPLIKLDIEGAEVEVIERMASTSVRPRQILIEFDELTVPSARSRRRAESADRCLRQMGYLCRFTDNRSNFLYVFD